MILMRPSPLLSLALLTACSLRPYTWDGATGSSTTSTESTTTTDPTTTGPTSTTTLTTTNNGSTTTAPTTSEPATAGCGFLDCKPDLPDTPNNNCDGSILPIQDCPEGQKCTFESEVWDTHCVDIVPDPKGIYEPCQILMGNYLSGYDDCGPGLVCWNVDPDTGIGQCIGLCGGRPSGYACADEAANCTYCQECAMGFCFPGCDPILQDCPGQELCIPEPMGDGFLCVLDASGDEGQAFDPCEYANACDIGLICADPAQAKECDPMAPGCCLPFCDLTSPVCPGDGLACVPWYEPGMAPPGLENLGSCRLPP